MSDKKFSFVSLFITRRCNLTCSYCNLPDDKVYVMSGDEWINTIKQLHPYVEHFNLIGGEPTIHPELPQIIDYLNEIEASYSLVTNSTLPHVYYRNLLLEHKVKTLVVSIDTLDYHNGLETPEMYKSKSGVKLVKYIDNEMEFPGNLLISSVISTVGNTIDLLSFADFHGCMVALSILQHSTNELQLNSNNPNNHEPNKEETIEVLKYVINRYHSLSLTDPLEYYIAILNEFILGKSEWHCSKGLTPAIDCNGDFLSCFDYFGELNINLLKEKFDPSKHFDAVQLNCKSCPGCTWNCPFVAEMVYNGLIESPFI